MMLKERFRTNSQKIRVLLDYPMNKYQDLNWAQATLFFECVVKPCEDYIMDGLLDLATNYN